MRERHLKEYMEVTGCSRATAYRHWVKFREGESPFDKDYKNNVNFISSKGYELRIRTIFFANPMKSAKDIWDEIGRPESPSYSVVKRFVRKLREELESE
jgi:hypothetical protein